VQLAAEVAFGLLGRRIHRNGYIENSKPTSVTIFKQWLEENNKNLPEGSLIVQSSCGQVWPYPALLYGRGNWPAIDLIFTLPDVPMTFMNEIDGAAYRIHVTNVYEQKELPKKKEGIFKRSKSHIALEMYLSLE